LIVTNSCGADTFTQSLTVVGIEGGFAGEIVVAPNPARDRFAFSVSGLGMEVLQVEMMDMQGRVCAHWACVVLWMPPALRRAIISCASVQVP
jgi:hypothetical protein